MPGTKKKWQELRDAVERNDAAKVTALAAAGLDLRKEQKYYDACVTAIQQGASEVLDALLKAGRGFHFSDKRGGDSTFFDHDGDYAQRKNREMACALIDKARASQNPGALLPVLFQNRCGILEKPFYTADFLDKNAPKPLLEACLKSKDDSAFSACITKTGLSDTDKLDYILSFFLENNSYHTNAITAALATVAARGDTDDIAKATLLLGYGADANADNAKALLLAAENGHQNMVNLLIPHVALETHGKKIITQLRHKGNIDPAIIHSIETDTQKAAGKIAAESAPVQPLSDRFNRPSANVLEEILPPDGELKETVRYYFETRQQVFMTDGKSTLAVSFNSLDDGVEDALRARLNSLPNPETAQSRHAPLQVHRLRPAAQRA